MSAAEGSTSPSQSETAIARELKAIYNQRSAIERLNGRLKDFRKLNYVRVRGRQKVRAHAMMAVLVTQAQALATNSRVSVRSVVGRVQAPIAR